MPIIITAPPTPMPTPTPTVTPAADPPGGVFSIVTVELAFEDCIAVGPSLFDLEVGLGSVEVLVTGIRASPERVTEEANEVVAKSNFDPPSLLTMIIFHRYNRRINDSTAVS
ncbi:hypothetical protein GLAREA_05051 [Glarea lozoyensis ATCC 20868]|uniref:Uncharacterized protein n=1 Tax=Glarea lozoyensis (strain ATCC 20868 / MF5171) TaxID=1116229 RepID=S3DF32_GLAL2|nr:uncharacterized protein GLAREA_05051 [Glarea lozoyensis ATCC 20868]EPE35714.1 hypothetical protein GLAREA_05051 [Glarea lozoyensis ATCC 20868]